MDGGCHFWLVLLSILMFESLVFQYVWYEGRGKEGEGRGLNHLFGRMEVGREEEGMDASTIFNPPRVDRLGK